MISKELLSELLDRVRAFWNSTGRLIQQSIRYRRGRVLDLPCL